MFMFYSNKISMYGSCTRPADPICDMYLYIIKYVFLYN